MKTCKIVRGYPGSGRTTLAAALARDSVLLSVDAYLRDRLPGLSPGKDIFTTQTYGAAVTDLMQEAQRVFARQEQSLVVDTIAPRLWELRDLLRLSIEHGYQFDVIEPTTSWARDPKECARRTRIPSSISTKM